MLAIVLFVLELTVTSHGLLAIGGLVAFVLGASALYTQPGTPTAPSVEVAVPIIVAMTSIAALFVGVVLYAALRTRRMPPVNLGVHVDTMPSDLIGSASEVRRALLPDRDRLCCRGGMDRTERGRPQPRARHTGADRGPGRPGADRGSAPAVTRRFPCSTP